MDETQATAQQKAAYSTALTKVNDTFLPMIERQLSGNGIHMDDYSKQCVLSALSAMHTALEKSGTSFSDSQVDKSNVTQVLLSIAALKLNAAAHPREVFFQVRNAKSKGPDGKEAWKKQIEMGIEGDGNDAILARFGRDVAKVGQFWLVRENDPFEYPKFNGLDYEPPKWTPTGKGAVVRVVYPVIKKDKSIEFYIGEKDDVLRNLMAHINNNLMSETFGLAKSRFEATPQQLKEIATRKAAVLKKAHGLGWDALDDEELQKWISPAWTDYHSRESMIIRKMRNNVVKKIPKDFSNAFVQMTYAEQVDEAEAALRLEAQTQANGAVIDVETGEVQTEPEATGEEPTGAEGADGQAPTAQPEAPPPAAQAAAAKGAPVQQTFEQAAGPTY